jgi:MerR family redox-sensitive transcriptional activator SoxR
MKIAELARKRGLKASAIRYYESVGVLAAPRRVSGRREYGEEAVDALRIVQAMQAAGFTLPQIRSLVRLGPSGGTERWRAEARSKVAQLDEQIAQLAKARDALVCSLECACGGGADACGLVRATEAMARRRR